MNRLILSSMLIIALSACNKSPDNASQASSSTMDEATKAQLNSAIASDSNAIDPAKEREAELAAIAHDRYDPDSIYSGAENIDIPPPQLKRKLLPGEALEVKFRPAEAFVGFQVSTYTVLDTTRLSVFTEIDDVLDKIEMDNPNCKVSAVEPYTFKLPKHIHYGGKFNLLLKGCTADEIKEVYFYTAHGKLTYTAIVED